MTQVADGTGEGAWEVCPPSSLTGLSAKHTCLFAAASDMIFETRDNRHVLSLYILGPKVIGPFPHDMSPTPTSHQRPSWDAYVLHASEVAASKVAASGVAASKAAPKAAASEVAACRNACESCRNPAHDSCMNACRIIAQIM